MSARVSVLVTARDEEEQLPGALASIEGMADAVVVVVDPRTTDRTREVAAAAGASVLEHPFASSGSQCNWGLDRCPTDWVFVLDADERPTTGLRDEMTARVGGAGPRRLRGAPGQLRVRSPRPLRRLGR